MDKNLYFFLFFGFWNLGQLFAKLSSSGNKSNLGKGCSCIIVWSSVIMTVKEKGFFSCQLYACTFHELSELKVSIKRGSLQCLELNRKGSSSKHAWESNTHTHSKKSYIP